jgi:hypothetical protein
VAASQRAYAVPPIVDEIVPFSRATHQRTPERDALDTVATALLDLAGSYESALRTVLVAHRLFERVRRCSEMSGEAELLIQEMARHLAALGEGLSVIGDRLDETSLRIAALTATSAE